MLKQEIIDGNNGGTGTGTGNFNNWARVCDTCRSAACSVYCRADSAYLCAGCDARIHAANKVASRHERVWVCESCERAPAAFLCKADAASLCTACDADIHSANPLARRHHRVPILPISGSFDQGGGGGGGGGGGDTVLGHDSHEDDTEDGFVTQEGEDIFGEEDEDEAASWLLLNTGKDGNNQSNGFLFGGEADEYLDLLEYNSSVDNHEFNDQYNHQQQQQQNYTVSQKSYAGDSVVPIQKHQLNVQLGMEYESSKPHYSYNTSISQNVSVSSMDVGIVPESTTSDISISQTISSNGTIDIFNGPPIQMPLPQLTPMDREAKVLRYREKKKTRKFEKTIRYASRKAYAETRPRIKGRFAKRTDVEIEVDQMFSTTLISESGYGIVPSF